MTYGEIRRHAEAERLNVILPEADEFLGKEYYNGVSHIVGVTTERFKDGIKSRDRDSTVFVVGQTVKGVRGHIRGIADMLARSGTPYRHTYSTNTIQVNW